MTDPSPQIGQPAAKRLRQRYNAERRFKRYGQIAIAVAVGFLAILLISIGTRAASAFSNHTVTVTIDPSDFSDREDVSVTQVNLAVREALQDLFPETRIDSAARTDLFGLTTRLADLAGQAPAERHPAAGELGKQGRQFLRRQGMTDCFEESVAALLVAEGFTELEEIAYVEPEELLSVEGLHRILLNLITNFTSFAPLGTVLVSLLGIAVAEHSGFIGTLLRLLVLKAPKNLLTFVIDLFQ